ncbi:hypothetical protein ACROYT_G013228 [Oculina patagonica]
MARNRVAPLKQLSIPRLDLQAAVLAVRLYNLVKQELSVTVKDTIFWSDSKTVLQYISNESRRFHTFVANRVSEIHNGADPTQWRHVPGHLNPADDYTRGLRAADLDKHCRWLNGPAFLSKPEEQWPQDTFTGPLRENDDEVKNTKWSGHASVTDPRAYFPDPEKFSSWTRFQISNAELIAVRKSQRDSFGLDFEALKANKHLSVKSRLSALRPYIDEAECLRPHARMPWKTEKRYGVLFTCLTTRAVHLEIAHSLDTNSCLMALRRMKVKRGKPANIWSDNGTNFVGAEKELREAVKRLDSEQIGDQLSADGVQWHFNPPSSPHFGGVWERLVQSAKRALKVVAGKKCVNDETLLMMMSMMKRHFLLGQGNPNVPPDVVNDRDLCSGKRWKHAQVMTQHFWKRWLHEYLPALPAESGQMTPAMFVKETSSSSSMRIPLAGVGH